MFSLLWYHRRDPKLVPISLTHKAQNFFSDFAVQTDLIYLFCMETPKSIKKFKSQKGVVVVFFTKQNLSEIIHIFIKVS